MKVWLKKSQCTGCGACSNICSRGAIKMVEDDCGFKYPVIDKNLCIDCGLCKNTCPIVSKYKPNRLVKPKVYATWSNDAKNRYISTSGGMFFELGKYVIEKSGFVIGARYNEDNMVEHYLVNNLEGLEFLRQSKYLQSDTKNIFKETLDALKTKKLVLFAGTPCQIASLLKFLKKDYENLITVEFICRGVNSPKAYKAWLSEIENLENSKVTKVWFKYKVNGWKTSPKCTRVDFKNGNYKIYDGPANKYMSGYLGPNLYIRPSCGNCYFKDLPRQADITLADFWGVQKDLDDDKGTSLVLVNSSNGQKYFDEIKTNIYYEERNIEEIYNGNACFKVSVKINKKSEKFLKSLNNKNFSKMLNKYNRLYPLKQKLSTLKNKIVK